MAVYFYSKSCDGCSGNQALKKIEQLCKKNGLDFSERRTILYYKWEEEADKIMENNPGLKLPFFFNEDTQEAMSGYSGTPLMELKKFMKGTK